MLSARNRVAKALVVIGLLGGNGCYTETFEKEIVIYPANRFAYEIQLHSHHEGRGNHHDFFDFSRKEWDSVYSICVNSLKGKIVAADLLFTQMTECRANPSFWIDQDGYIEFRDGYLTVALEAVYTKEMGARRPLAANGTYKIVQIPAEPSE